MNFLFIYSCIQAAATLVLHCMVNGETWRHVTLNFINHNTGHLFFAHSGNPKIPKYLKISILGSASNMVITYRRWLFFQRLQWRLLTIAKQGEGHHSINPIGLHHTHIIVKDSDTQLLCPFNLWIEQSTPTGKVPGITPIEVLISTTHRASTSTQDPSGSDWSKHNDGRTHLCITSFSKLLFEVVCGQIHVQSFVVSAKAASTAPSTPSNVAPYWNPDLFIDLSTNGYAHNLLYLSKITIVYKNVSLKFPPSSHITCIYSFVIKHC